MSFSVEQYLRYRMLNAPIRRYPYPHFYLENVWPADFYQALQENWPANEEMVSLADTGRVTPGAYRARRVTSFEEASLTKLALPKQAFWREMKTWLLSPDFFRTCMMPFQEYADARIEALRGGQFSLAHEGLIVSDGTTYSIGPHTDSPKRLMSYLFYCPPDDSQLELGTSIFVPRDPNFVDVHGGHSTFDLFHRVATMPFIPNSLFAFVRRDNSFHGVEPIQAENVERRLLLYDIRIAGNKK